MSKDGAQPDFAAPTWHSAVPGVVWPAIGSDAAAHLQGLLFQLEQSQWLAPEQLLERQLDQLRIMLRHARSTTPFYADALATLEVDGLDATGLIELPLLARAALQAEFDGLTSRRPPASHGPVSVGESSGSTGMPVKFLGTAATRLFWDALTLREHFWQQRDFSGKLAAIRVMAENRSLPDWGPPVATVFHTGPAVTLNVRTDVVRQLAWLQREKPAYLLTHASNLSALAELSIKHGVALPGLRQVRTFSETLHPDLRDKVRAAWGVEIADVYSSAEVGVIALQCPLHAHYHVQSENLIVEILRPDGAACAPGEIGEVVVTTLHNFAMPLIRYRIGDYAEAGDACECGRGLPVMRRIHGRQRNMLKLPDGRSHWPSISDSAWRSVASVEQFQLAQTQLDRIEARYVMGRDLTSAEIRQIAQALEATLRFPFSIDFRRVERIERAVAHKFEDFISLLPPAGES